MAAPREQHLVGRDYLTAVTVLLQRVRSAHPTAGLYEAADLQWWWRTPRSTDNVPQLFWFDHLGRPEAAVIATDWGDRIALDPIVMPDATPDWISDVMERGLAHAGECGFEAVSLEVDPAGDVLRNVLIGHGFGIDEGGIVEAWLEAKVRPEISELNEDYRLFGRTDTMQRPHHMINATRNHDDIEARLHQTSLYRPDLDLLVLDRRDSVAAYGLFWFDPDTRTGLVEPMRTDDDHQRRGLARHLLTTGIDRLAAAGAERIKICFEPDNPAARALYLSVGFEPDRQTVVYSGPAGARGDTTGPRSNTISSARMEEFDALLERFDVDDAAFIADPYPTLGAIRDATPIYWNDSTRQWVITRFADVHATLRDRRLGRAYTHRFSHAELGRADPDPRWVDFQEHEAWSLLCLEPPDHTRIRRLITKVFTPRAIVRLAPQIEATSDDLLDRCADAGTFDLLADYAQPFSVAVICSMLGVPVADTQRLLDWSHAIVKMSELAAPDAVKAAANDAAREYIVYTRELIAEKRRRPDELLVSQLVQVEDAGDTLTEAEIISTTMVLVEAGHEATVNTLGNGFRALMHHRDEWRRLVDGSVGADTAVEELLRFDAPLQLFERWVLEPGVEIAGQPIAVGDEVAMLFGSAQRDPRRFDAPDRFDVARGDTAHIGFGGGVHFCIGAPLARAELTRSVTGLAERFPDLELVEEPTYHPTFVIRGLTALRLATGT